MKTIKSYAKINPLLKIGSRRVDGYHNLFLLYQTISLFDTITVHLLDDDGIELTCSRDDIPCNSDNFAYQAAALLKHDFKVETGISIHIEKHIPAGGGLGGGSSNAAAILKELNNLFELKLSKNTLMEYAAQIGSDVPFFIEGGSAAGIGRGDIIIPMKPFPELNGVAVFPDVSFMTGTMYQSFSKLFNPSDKDLFVQTADFYSDPLNSFNNDFDRVVHQISERVFSVMQLLRERGYCVMLSGSGSTFLVFGEHVHLEEIRHSLPGCYTCHPFEFVQSEH